MKKSTIILLMLLGLVGAWVIYKIKMPGSTRPGDRDQVGLAQFEADKVSLPRR